MNIMITTNKFYTVKTCIIDNYSTHMNAFSPLLEKTWTELNVFLSSILPMEPTPRYPVLRYISDLPNICTLKKCPISAVNQPPSLYSVIVQSFR